MKRVGRGWMESLRARVDEDVLDLIKSNRALRRARYGRATRFFRSWIAGRTLLGWLAIYAVCLSSGLLFEGLGDHYLPSWLAGFDGVAEDEFVRDAAGFFITAQVGLLAVLTVAVSVVTLLSERDEGRSVNTDVRLYYVESHAAEFATSSIAFLIVVVCQLFWPLQQFLQPLLHLRHLGFLKQTLTAVHAGWLILNFAIFLNFLQITLDFVVVANRSELRKRYVATEIIPKDVGRRLLAFYYQSAPGFVLPLQDLKEGPIVIFGSSLIGFDNGAVELSRSFKTPNLLYDVWLWPLRIALSSWHRRTRVLQGAPKERFGDTHWDGQLAVPHDPRFEVDGEVDLIMRQGGAPLRRWERAFIGWSLRFDRLDTRERSLPRPIEFMEQLVSNAIRNINSEAVNGFDDALKETTDFHSFLLEPQNTRDESGGKINLAQVSDGWFLRPDQEWVRAYHRAYAAAVNKMTTDQHFVNALARVPASLWPRNPETYPTSVLQGILELGRYQVVALEDWVTKRAVIAAGESGAAPALSGSDLRAYEEVLISFVSAWESLETIIFSSFRLPAASHGNVDAYWQTVRAAWAPLQSHLGNAAYLFASAVWNDDGPGGARYRDLVLRWLQTFYREVQNLYFYRDALLLTPDLLEGSPVDAMQAAKRTLLYDRADLDARSVFGVILREAQNDVICICGAVALYWYATKRQPSPTAARAGLLMLRRQTLVGEGADLLEHGQGPKPAFRLVFDLIIRRMFHSRHEDGSYSAYLGHLIQMLNTLSEPRMVPGRIYQGVALDGFDTLKPELLAVLAAHTPEDGDDGVGDLFGRLLKDDPAFKADRTLRDFDYELGAYSSGLAGEGDERFRTSFRLFDTEADVTARRLRLKAIFDGVRHAVSETRLKRIAEAEIDPEKRKRVVEFTTQRLLFKTQPIGAFLPTSVVRTSDRSIPEREYSFRELDRGLFTAPQMSSTSFADIPGFFANAAEQAVATWIWYEVGQRPRLQDLPYDRADVRGLFGRAADAARGETVLGENLALILPNDPFGSLVHMAAMGFPDARMEGLAVTRDEGIGSQSRYIGTVDGLPVFLWPFTDVAALCSRTLLTGVEFGVVRSGENIFEFELFDNGDPTKSSIRYWIAPRLSWEERPVLWFSLRSPGADEVPE